MKRLLLILPLLFLCVSAYTQYRMIGYGAWTAYPLGSDSTYYAEVTLKPDLTGFSYYGTHVADSMKVFTGTEQLYTIDSIGAQGFGFVQLYIKESTGFDGPPSGETLIFDPAGRQTIPNLPFGSSGATSQINAAVDAYNARLIGQAAGVTIDTTGLIYVESTILQGAIVDLDSAIANVGGSGGAFDGNRSILRVPSPGDNLATSTVTDWLEWWYFTAPTIAIAQSPTTTVFEVGTSTQLIYNGTVTNSGGATLSSGYFFESSPSADTLVSFAAATTFADTIQFTPAKDSTSKYKQFQYIFKATQSWSSDSESGTASSSNKTIYGVYPVLYGMSATDLSVGGDPYTTLTKLVEQEGDKTVSFTGSGYIYYAIPKTWGDFALSQIIDHNGFDVTPSFTAYDITVSSTGLTTDWSAVDYKLYKLNTTTTTSGYAYQFIR